MIKCILTVGCPASGKSTWAKAEVAKDPSNWMRINNDDLRAMLNGSVWSQDYEKVITDTRNYLIREAFKRGKNVILDNVNANRRHFEDVCKFAKETNVNVQVMEKAFYEELDVLLERDSKREGKAQVGEAVVRKWFKELGGKGHKFYKPRVEIFQERNANVQAAEAPLWIPNAPEAVICDLDGTLALIHNRSPYDATDCDIKDLPNRSVIETVLAHYKVGRKIIFCSGREDKYKPETVRFIEKHCQIMGALGGGPFVIDYELHMRKTSDTRKDAIIKEEIYQNEIEGKFNVLCILDDRDQVVQFWRSKGLTCFQVAPGAF